MVVGSGKISDSYNFLADPYLVAKHFLAALFLNTRVNEYVSLSCSVFFYLFYLLFNSLQLKLPWSSLSQMCYVRVDCGT